MWVGRRQKYKMLTFCKEHIAVNADDWATYVAGKITSLQLQHSSQLDRQC